MALASLQMDKGDRQKVTDKSMSLEPLSANIILSRLRTSEIGRPIYYFPRVSSTMDVALEEIERGATHGSAIIADEQTGGKGRL